MCLQVLFKLVNRLRNCICTWFRFPNASLFTELNTSRVHSPFNAMSRPHIDMQAITWPCCIAYKIWLRKVKQPVLRLHINSPARLDRFCKYFHVWLIPNSILKELSCIDAAIKKPILIHFKNNSHFAIHWQTLNQTQIMNFYSKL